LGSKHSKPILIQPKTLIIFREVLRTDGNYIVRFELHLRELGDYLSLGNQPRSAIRVDTGVEKWEIEMSLICMLPQLIIYLETHHSFYCGTKTVSAAGSGLW
jgi:hypothetical protein